MIKRIISHLAIFQAIWPKNPRIIKITAMMIKIIASVNNVLDKNTILRTLVIHDAYISIVNGMGCFSGEIYPDRRESPSAHKIRSDFPACQFRAIQMFFACGKRIT